LREILEEDPAPFPSHAEVEAAESATEGRGRSAGKDPQRPGGDAKECELEPVPREGSPGTPAGKRSREWGRGTHDEDGELPGVSDRPRRAGDRSRRDSRNGKNPDSATSTERRTVRRGSDVRPASLTASFSVVTRKPAPARSAVSRILARC